MEAPRAVYPTDLSNSQWRIIRPLIPTSKPIGADRSVSMRAVLNGVLYRERSGCSWRMLPHDFPHWRTVYGYFQQWKGDGTWQHIKSALRQNARRGARRRKEAAAGGLTLCDCAADFMSGARASCAQQCGDRRASG